MKPKKPSDPRPPRTRSRRDFLRDTTALTASLLAAPALVHGQQQPPPAQGQPPPAQGQPQPGQEQPPAPPPPPRPEPQVKIGIIGVGGMGSGHRNSLVSLHKQGKE